MVSAPWRSVKKATSWCVPPLKDRTLKLWQDGQCTSSTIAHDKDINDVALSPGCVVVASCSSDRTAKLWDSSIQPAR